MKPKWIKIGDTERDLFDVLDLFKKGESIDKMASTDNRISVEEIRKLLSRTKTYLKSHLILDSYLETVNKFPQTNYNLEWTANEIRELVELHINGASVKNITALMRKDIEDIKEKLISLKLIKERK